MDHELGESALLPDYEGLYPMDHELGESALLQIFLSGNMLSQTERN